jgi:hypothetical protein
LSRFVNKVIEAGQFTEFAELRKKAALSSNMHSFYKEKLWCCKNHFFDRVSEALLGSNLDRA